MSNHIKILLVDDDTDDQLFFMDAVRALDPTLECTIANNGVEALDHLRKVPPPPTLIFLDLNMPLMNGFECLAQLKKITEYKNIPVIIFTTSSHPVDLERTMLMGAVMFVTKPPDFNILKDKISDIIHTYAFAG